MAIRLGLCIQQAEQLAVEACKGMGWHFKKFRNFVTEFVDDEIWTDDKESHVMKEFLPTKDGFEQALKEIYRTRGGSTHEGQSYPPTGTVLGGASIPLRASMQLVRGTVEGTQPFPPIVWFERVVNLAFRRLLERSAKIAPQPSPGRNS